jgi:WD40 repeat protein
VSSQPQISVTHAPQLLDGPKHNDKIPDINLSGLDMSSSDSMNSLLLALGLSVSKPTPPTFKFSKANPMGGATPDITGDEEATKEHKPSEGHTHKLSPECINLVSQATALKNNKECIMASNRILTGVQTQVSRRLVLRLMTLLSQGDSTRRFQAMEGVRLDNVQYLIRLLRLVQGNKISYRDNIDKMEGCIESAISTLASQGSESGTQLLQACSRDLLAAAVGGSHSLSKKDETSKAKMQGDLTVLCNPSFRVSKSLVETLTQTVGSIHTRSSHELSRMVDALAACLFSSKLELANRFWALKQLLKVFSTICGKKKPSLDHKMIEMKPVPSQILNENGQLMNYQYSKINDTIYTISEDFSVKLMKCGTEDSELLSIPDDIKSQGPELLLPMMELNFFHTCLAVACGSVLCIWRLRDKTHITAKLPNLITSFSWRTNEAETEPPILLVGLVDGMLVNVVVHKVAVNLPLELDVNVMSDLRLPDGGAVTKICWSHGWGVVAISSSQSNLYFYSQYLKGLNLESSHKEKVISMSWSPKDHLLAIIDDTGLAKLYQSVDEDVYELSNCWTFDGYNLTTLSWHHVVNEHTSLLAGGSRDGTTHLWTITTATDETTPIKVIHLTTLNPPSPVEVSCLSIDSTHELLAIGYSNGNFSIWDLQDFKLLKSMSAETQRNITKLSWTQSGVIVCYQGVKELFVCPPTPPEYSSIRLFNSCLPYLKELGVDQPSSSPCLYALLQNIHHMIQDQYTYEHGEINSGNQLVHTEYLQLLTAFMVGLGLDMPLVSPPTARHLPPRATPSDWAWLQTFSSSLQLMDSFIKRTPLPSDVQYQLKSDQIAVETNEKYKPLDNSVWTFSMDGEIVDWVAKRPEDWWSSSDSHIYTWGKGTWNQLGQGQLTSDKTLPDTAIDWKNVLQVVAGSYCTYLVHCDGSVSSVGDGANGRLGHNSSDSESALRTIGAFNGESSLLG